MTYRTSYRKMLRYVCMYAGFWLSHSPPLQLAPRGPPAVRLSLSTYIHTYLQTYIKICLKWYIHTDLHTYIHTYKRSYSTYIQYNGSHLHATCLSLGLGCPSQLWGCECSPKMTPAMLSHPDIYIKMWVCIYVCMYVYLYVYMYVCFFVCMYIYLYVCMCSIYAYCLRILFLVH